MQYSEFIVNTSWVNLTSLFSVPVDDIMNEIQQVENFFHIERDKLQAQQLQEKETLGVSEYLATDNKWSAFTLLSSSGDYKDVLTQGINANIDKKEIVSTYRNIRQHKWTELSELMPKTILYVRSAFEPIMKLSYVKIAKLSAGGVIPKHTDKPNKEIAKNTINSYHMLNSILIELNSPKGIIAKHNDDIIDYQKGSVYWFNQSREHEVIHNGNKDRYNIRIQGMYNRKFRELIKNNIHMLQYK